MKRGAPASLESVTVETMIQMMLRVIEDMREMIPQLTEPLVNRIQNTLRKLQERMYMFRQFANDACMPDA